MNKILYLTTISLAVILIFCAVPNYLIAAPTPQQISIYQKHIQSHQDDLLTITRTANTIIDRNDAEIAINLIDLTEAYYIQLEHIQDLLVIKTLVRNPDDKKRIRPTIEKRLKIIADRINISLQQVNLSIAHVKHQGIMATAIKLRDHLREVKEILEDSN